MHFRGKSASEKNITWLRIFCELWFNPLQPGVAFLYPLKTSRKPIDFLMFSGGKEKQHRAVMG